MPSQTKQAGPSAAALFQQLGTEAQQALAKHAMEDTKYGQTRLPGGINNGIARLEKIEFGTIAAGKTNAGKPFVQLTGVMLFPAEHDGCKVEGAHTRLIESLFPTPTKSRKTTQEHVVWFQNELKKLGIQKEQLATPQGIDAAIAMLNQIKPTFKVTTSTLPPTIDPKTKKAREPMVYEQWNGLVDFTGGDPAEHVQDESGGTPASSVNGDQPTPEAEAAGTVDIAALVQLCGEPENSEAGNDARRRLAQLAVDCGRTTQEVTEAESWEQIGQWVEEAMAGGEDESGDAAAEAAPAGPKKGDLGMYVLRNKEGKPIKNPSTKKDKPPVKVEVQSFDPAANTVELLNKDDGKTVYKGVPVDQLLPVS